MALPKTYGTNSTAGAGTTATVASGGTAVTGIGTAWNGVIKADDYFEAVGQTCKPVRIASVTDNTHLVLAEPWPGTALSGDDYEIKITYDGPEFQLRTRELLESLTGAVTDIVAGDGITVDASDPNNPIISVAKPFANLTDAAAYNPDTAPSFTQTVGHTSAGDGGGALYKLVVAEPSHEGKYQDAAGNWYELAQQRFDIRMFGAVGDGTTDDLAALQAAADWHQPVYFPPLVFATSDTVTFSDGTRLIGSGGDWKAKAWTRTDDGVSTEILYIGSGGSDSAVIRASQIAVGVEGTDFTAPGTSDLRNVTFTGFHINANNLAEIGLYCYRLGLGTVIDDISVEKAKEVDQLILGGYAAYYGRLGAFYSEKHGFIVGDNYFGWTSSEATCYAFNATLYTAQNGTAGTFVKNDATHDTDGSGGIFRLGRGSRVTITSENNDGRSMIIRTMRTDFTDGPVFYNVQYQEGNGAGFRVEYDNKATRHIIHGGFVNTDQDIRIVAQVNGTATDDSGSNDQNRWLELRDMFGSDASNGFVVNSNTTKFYMRYCTDNAQFSDRAPARYDDYISSTVASGSAVSLTSGASANVTSITLKPGIWEVSGLVGYAPAATTNITRFIQSISQTSATTDAVTGGAMTADNFPGGAVMGSSVSSYRRNIGPIRIKVAADTVVYLVASATFTVSTLGAFGHISAKRVF